MFLEFPLEITLKVISQLEFEDKLNLKSTCHKLNDLITKAILYEDLNLIDPLCKKGEAEYKIAVNTFLQKFIDNEFDGSVVKTLRVDMTALSNHIISQLSDLFPNIKRLINSIKPISGYSFKLKNRRAFDADTNPLIKWRKTIEKIDFREDWDEIVADLSHFEYPRLTELHVSTSFVLKAFQRHEGVLLFNNAPLLTTLSVYDTNITLEMLEAIHTAFPLLQSLKLIGTTMRVRNDATLPSPITPANNIKYLELNYSSGFNTNGVTYMYMLSKYPILQQLVYSVNPREDYNILTLNDFLFNRGGRKDAYEEALSRSKETYQVYSSFETMLFSSIPKSIKTLTLKMINMENAISALADSGTKLTVLDLLGRHIEGFAHMRLAITPKPFVEADILKKITKMTSLKTLKIPIRIPSRAFPPNTISLSITKLFISLYGKSTSIESILYMFPSLEELYVFEREYMTENPPKCQIKGRDTEEMQPKSVYPKLRILDIERSPIHSGLFSFVDTALPNLNQLRLGVILPSTRITKLDLSGCDVNNWNLSFAGTNVDCTIIMQNTTKRLLIHQNTKSLKLAHQNTIVTSEKDTKYVEVTVDRIKNFKIGGFAIVKVGDKIYADCTLLCLQMVWDGSNQNETLQ